MKKDIRSREDIVNLLEAFYTKAFADDLIGRFFTEMPLDLETHIPLIADFWESIVFGTFSYQKNVMEVHRLIHERSAIRKEHLDRWVKLFSETMDSSYEGSNATLMLQRARSVATLMDIKLNHGPFNSPK